MENRDRYNLKAIQVLGIISFVMEIIIIIFIFLAFLFSWFFLFGFLLLVPTLILSFVGSIMILAINWNSKILNEKKILWGLLALLLLGSIALMVFGSSKIN